MSSIPSLRAWVASSMLALASVAPAKELPPLDLFRDPEITRLFESLPVQEGGRIKPLLKMANVRLQASRALQSIWLTESGESDGKPLVDPATQKPLLTEKGKPIKLTSVQWLLMSWFRPDIGRTVPLFKVDNSSAVAELGLDTRAKRSQYTYQEIEPAREVLMQKMTEYRQIPAKEQTPEQRIIVELAAKYLDYDMIMGHFDFIRSPVGENADKLPPEIPQPLRLSKSLPDVAKTLTSGGPPMQIPWFRDFAQAALGAMMSGNPEGQLRIFPSSDKTIEVWHGPGEMIFGAVNGSVNPTPEQLQWLALYEDLYLALPDAAKFKATAEMLVSKVKAAAQERGEGQFVNLEIQSIKADYFFYAQWLFVLGLIGVGLTWISPGARLDKIGRCIAWGFLGLATALTVTGVILRCIIMQRPPIATLYETILFIGASCAFFGLISEWISKRGLGLLIAGLAGGGCMFLAIQFDTADATDNLQQLQAVLITNFWLSTHVPIINLGYAACMVATLISMKYFVQRIFGQVKTGDDEARFMTRTAYGFVCFGLLLSLVGTVLGGIWANYSWGRFWGWDPKENGALMIVLMCLVILHARLGGYIREIGLHCCNLILGCIVIFSWFGVNQLGVGLHAYGFTDGTWPKIYSFWAIQMLLLTYGLILAYLEGRKSASVKTSAA
ncbi:cytochrome c biogenesis protein [Prosthecobacter dejongeii]|uniref:ABC-type transport system involved in cytochrome c biogenesis permease subunit n=1 Tax=Prosthecobacter dejongeii TaxID=48465 RepID=A0A7W7YNH8_9BACT|nr:cytochrome c biogenesis protein CcsA [Prosthecobacter dejongeii]MBB5039252.1 ABC-type transport system involved in cytochrome c biogenesis permease subunit [Prosthecobacter dejongeii]